MVQNIGGGLTDTTAPDGTTWFGSGGSWFCVQPQTLPHRQSCR
jgi:hypothetical protein